MSLHSLPAVGVRPLGRYSDSTLSFAAESAVVAVRSQLERSGIPIVAQVERYLVPELPVLGFLVQYGPRCQDRYRVEVSLELQEKGCLSRLPDSCRAVTSWSEKTSVEYQEVPRPDWSPTDSVLRRVQFEEFERRRLALRNELIQVIREIGADFGQAYVRAYRHWNPLPSGK